MKHAAPSTTRPRWQFLAAPLVALVVAAPVVVGAATTTITRSEAQAAADTLAAYLAQPEPTVTVTEAGPTVTVTAVPTATPTSTVPPVTPTPSPTPTVPPTGAPVGALPFTPPILDNPVTLTIAAGGGTYSAPATRDCVIVAPVVITGPVTLSGCDDRVWVNGEFGGRTTTAGFSDSGNRGIRLSDAGASATGTDYLEGLWFRPGTYLSDAVQIAHRSTSRTVILQNVRVDAYTWGTRSGVHGDTIQCWGGPSELHVYGLTARLAAYQGVYCDAADGRSLPAQGDPWTFERMNIVGTNAAEQARYLYADREPGFTRATATDVWISGSPYNNADGFGNAPAGVKVGTVADFVPASWWADGYVSPGYV